MNNRISVNPGLKQKAIHELKEVLGLSFYLAFFFCALATYSALLLGGFHVTDVNYAFAIFNALVVAKVILIGEYAKVGTRFESRHLLLSVLWKAVLFTLLVFAFHAVEEAISSLLHGESVSAAYHEIKINLLLARSLIVFCTFLPLFAFREIRRVLGYEKFTAMVFGHAESGK